MHLYEAFRWVQHIQHLTFPDSNSMNKSYFFWTLILDVIFCDFGKTWCQRMDLGTPPAAQLNPKMAAKVAHFSKMVAFFSKMWPTFRRLACEVAFGALLGTILVDLGIHLAPNLWIFARLFYRFQCCFCHLFNAALSQHYAVLTTKIEEMPRTAKNWQKPKANERR